MQEFTRASIQKMPAKGCITPPLQAPQTLIQQRLQLTNSSDGTMALEFSNGNHRFAAPQEAPFFLIGDMLKNMGSSEPSSSRSAASRGSVRDTGGANVTLGIALPLDAPKLLSAASLDAARGWTGAVTLLARSSRGAAESVLAPRRIDSNPPEEAPLLGVLHCLSKKINFCATVPGGGTSFGTLAPEFAEQLETDTLVGVRFPIDCAWGDRCIWCICCCCCCC